MVYKDRASRPGWRLGAIRGSISQNPAMTSLSSTQDIPQAGQVVTSESSSSVAEIRRARKRAAVSVRLNLSLAIGKGLAGVLAGSSALLSDVIHSGTDVIASAAAYIGLWLAVGICTSAPYYHTTGDRLKSFLVSSSTAVPILIGYLLARYLFGYITPMLIGFIIGATAGLMIYITIDEIIPNSCAGTDHQTIFSLLTGIILSSCLA